MIRRAALPVALALSLALASAAQGAIAFVRTATNDAGGTPTTLTITVTINAGDNVLVMFTLGGGGAQSVTSVKDNNLVSYTFVASAGDNINFAKEWAYSSLNAAAATSITITYGTGALSNAIVLVYSGVGSVGTTASNNNASSTNPTVSLTTQDSNNWVVAAFTQLGSGGAATAQNGTIRQNEVNTNQASRIMTAVDNTAASPSSVTDSYTIPAAENYQALAVELRVPAAAGRGLFRPAEPFTGVGVGGGFFKDPLQ